MKPDQIETNERLILAVFQELEAKAPDGIRYLAMRFTDGTFIHFVLSENGALALPTLESFKQFQTGFAERCAEAPQRSDATIVGNYRMLTG